MSKPIDPVDAHVGAKIRHWRTVRKMKQSELAAAIGVVQQSVCQYETGENRCAPSKLYAIAGALGIRVGWLFADLDGEFCSNCEDSGFVERSSPSPPAFEDCPRCHNPKGHLHP